MEKEPALPRNIRQIGEISGREKVCIEDYVMTCIHKHEQQEEKGYLGIFFGEQQETEDSVFIFIRGIFEIPAEIQGQQEQEALRQEYEKYFGDWTVQGCCVIGIYPTERMKALAAWLPESGKLIYHLQEQEETLYWTGEDQYRRLPGYFVFYEQNKRMQEYLSQVFRDNSVEKESAPDQAVHSFREKVKEKGEQRHGSFLRMASSFFVITVLIIGAIVVNRIEDIRAVRSLSFTDGGASGYQAQQTEEDVQSSAVSGNVSYQPAEEMMAQKEADVQGDVSTETGAVLQDAAAADGTEKETESDVQDDAVRQAAAEAELAGSDAFWEQSDLEDITEQSEDGSSLTDSADPVPAATEQSADENQEAQEAVAVRNMQAGYVIKEGDTLAKICSRYYGTIDRVEEVCEANGIENANLILPGQRIVLP